MSNLPNMRQINRFNVNKPGFEVITQPLYDYQEYAALGTTQMNFFQVPKGQGSKTLADTNMTTAGVLAQPQTFVARGIFVEFFSGVLVSPAEDTAKPFVASQGVNDVMAIMKAPCWLDFFIGSKSYLQYGPLMRFPAPNGLGGFAAMSADGAAGESYNVTQYARATGPMFKFKAPIRLEANQNFNVSLNFPTAVATPSTVAGRIGVHLVGDLYRKSQ